MIETPVNVKKELEKKIHEIGRRDHRIIEIIKLKEKIEWLAKRFEDYERKPEIGWGYHIYSWLKQFDDHELPVAMKIIGNIIYTDQELYKELQRHVYQNLIDYMKSFLNLEEKEFLDQALFFPVGGAGEVHLTDFFRVNGVEGRKDRIKGKLYLDDPDVLLSPPKKIENSDVLAMDLKGTDVGGKYKNFLDEILTIYKLFQHMQMEILKKKYSGRKYLCILTDFIGSGNTITRDLRKIMKIVKYYNNFEKIFVLAYAGTECAIKKIQNLNSKKIENIICGMELPQHTKVFDNNNFEFKKDERDTIKQICKKYFSRFDHPDIEEFGEDVMYGYRGDEYSCGNGILMSLYTNIPNNSLPILWAGKYENYNNSGKWIPLFRRVPSYTIYITGGTRP